MNSAAARSPEACSRAILISHPDPDPQNARTNPIARLRPLMPLKPLSPPDSHANSPHPGSLSLPYIYVRATSPLAHGDKAFGPPSPARVRHCS
ncbi:hypothetical protein EJ04DRAFT_103252 [Polyplosphaeria fusca]|uniref:Uncharacterized protein n=1 Tax=Polyplosphaeria fusca TaxID=682080 RepID=A0A9P4V5T5_9PLEO|nr:hypothetical protein EJ04DRAFT_103252 [Polyplosphaeria fusca]